MQYIIMKLQSSLLHGYGRTRRSRSIIGCGVIAGDITLDLTSRPQSGQTYDVINYKTHTGTFSSVGTSATYAGSECDSIQATENYGPNSFSISVEVTDTCQGALSPGAIAGIAVGAIVLVGLVVALPIYLKLRKEMMDEANTLSSMASRG